MTELKPVKKAFITILMDNYTDVLLPSDQWVQRIPLLKEGKMAKNPVAEHGLSLLIAIDEEWFILDFGLTDFGLIYNMDILGIDASSIPFGVLSHGHHDHLGAFYSFLEKRKGPFTLYLHGDALLERRHLSLPSGDGFYFPQVERAGVGRHQITVNEWALELGGHCRTGLEDNVRFDKGRLAASNAELVARVGALTAEFGRSVATPVQARQILGLRGA